MKNPRTLALALALGLLGAAPASACWEQQTVLATSGIPAGWVILNEYSGSPASYLIQNVSCASFGYTVTVLGWSPIPANFVITNQQTSGIYTYYVLRFVGGAPAGDQETVLSNSPVPANWTIVGQQTQGSFVYNIIRNDMPPNTISNLVVSPAGPVTVRSGQAVLFTASATDSSSLYTVHFNWNFGDGHTAAGASVSHTFTNTGTADAVYHVVCTAQDDSNARATANAGPVTVQAADHIVPAFATQPSSPVASGAAVQFQGSATSTYGFSALTYAWDFGDGATGSGQTASHAYTNAGTSNLTRTVTLTATDPLGYLGSVTGPVTVLPAPRPPSITGQPYNLAVSAGQTATFSVVAAGSPTLAYQWYLNGAAISGATGSAYTTPAATRSMSGGKYSVTVTNAYGTVTSASAVLTVMNTLTVRITKPTANQGAGNGGTLACIAVATDSDPNAVITYSWDVEGGGQATGARVALPLPSWPNCIPSGSPMSATIHVNATDDTGASADAYVTVKIAGCPID